MRKPGKSAPQKTKATLPLEHITRQATTGLPPGAKHPAPGAQAAAVGALLRHMLKPAKKTAAKKGTKK